MHIKSLLSIIILICGQLDPVSALNPPNSQTRFEAVDTLYVSNEGNDQNDGSFTSPLKTIQKAADILSEGGTCFIRGGTYYEEVIIRRSNQTFRNYKNEYVIINGADTVTGWTRYKGKIWMSDYSGAETQYADVFIDGKFMQMARYPNNTTGKMLEVRERSGYADCYVYNGNGSESARKVTFNQDPGVPDNYWAGGVFRGISGLTWMNPVGIIEANAGKDLTVNPILKQWKENSDQIEGKGYGYIFHLNALDIPGEWFHKNGRLYLYPPQGIHPDSFRIEAKKREYAVIIENKSGIHLKGVHIKGASMKLEYANNCLIDSCSFRYMTPFFTSSNYGASFNSMGGIYLSGSDNTFLHCYIAGSWGHGIKIPGGKNNEFRDCIIEDIGWNAMFTSSMLVKEAGNKVTRCTFGSTGRFHIRMNAGVHITYSDFFDCMKMGQDAGSIQSVGHDLDGVEIAYNTIHDCNTIPSGKSAKQFVVAFYLEDALNYTVHHNIVWNIKTDVIPDGAFAYIGPRRETISDIYYYNNTVWNCDYRMRSWNRDGLGNIESSNAVFNNLFDSRMLDKGSGSPNLLTKLIEENNVYSSDPKELFHWSTSTDFTLNDSSKAIDAGRFIPGITDNAIGAAPDAGALEYGEEMWEVGADLDVYDFPEVKEISLEDPGFIEFRRYQTLDTVYVSEYTNHGSFVETCQLGDTVYTDSILVDTTVLLYSIRDTFFMESVYTDTTFADFTAKEREFSRIAVQIIDTVSSRLVLHMNLKNHYRSEVNVYPNPASETVFITYTGNIPSKVRHHLYNNMGQRIYSDSKVYYNGTMPEIEISMKHQPAGIYYLLTHLRNSLYVNKIIKQ